MKHLYLSKKIFIIILFISTIQIEAQDSKLKYSQKKYFKNIKQITFSGENFENIGVLMIQN